MDERWEWHPGLLAFRAELETAFEAGVAATVGGLLPGSGLPGDEGDSGLSAADVVAALWRLAGPGDGPSLSAYVAEHATLEQVRELAVLRSGYQLKEADPHTWAIPRLTGGPKAAMVEIQADEYGGGTEAAMHSSLFASTMDELGLDSTYGAYLDQLPGPALATVNLISLFGLHRRLRGAVVGHLAIFEMTSVGPMGRYANALDRLGVGTRARRFYDVHVEADVHHQLVAAERMAGRLAADEPALAPWILFGAAAVTAIEQAFTRHVLGAWSAGRSALSRPLPDRAG